LYAKTKVESAALSREKGETVDQYSARKDGVVRQIVARAVAELAR